jgi:hypothetical protein
VTRRARVSCGAAAETARAAAETARADDGPATARQTDSRAPDPRDRATGRAAAGADRRAAGAGVTAAETRGTHARGPARGEVERAPSARDEGETDRSRDRVRSSNSRRLSHDARPDDSAGGSEERIRRA